MSWTQIITIVAVLVGEACFALHHMVFKVFELEEWWDKPLWRTNRWHGLSGGGHLLAEGAAMLHAFPPLRFYAWHWSAVHWQHIGICVATSLAAWGIWTLLKLLTGRLRRWGSIWVP